MLGAADEHTERLPAVEEHTEGDEELTGVLEELPPGMGLLVVRNGPNLGSRYVLDAPVTSAGRHPDSDIFLDDITVSRRHAEIFREEGEFRVRDVGSLNGTYVNRERVDEAPLRNGDELQIGRYRFEFFSGQAD